MSKLTPSLKGFQLLAHSVPQSFLSLSALQNGSTMAGVWLERVRDGVIKKKKRIRWDCSLRILCVSPPTKRHLMGGNIFAK